ncbi:hypothetical protein [Demequina sp. SO4-18]|uniref:hypothetical protein n=1 Tax=Demequina sp. SO4-18 TaxID=3401026 RepID=UPI003B5985B6
MSDFHDALRSAARRHGEAVAPGLSADAVVASSVHGISRGRRRRAATQAGVGALGVAAIGVAGWLVLPLAGPGESEPAGPDDAVNAGPWRYEVGADPEAYPIEEPSVMLNGGDEVMCGDELSLEPGVTVHDPDAFGRQIYQEAELTTLGETVGTPTAEPRPLNSDDPDGIMTGWDPNQATWDGAIGGQLVGTETVSLLMDGDTVVGHAFGSSLSASWDGLMEGSGGGSIPREGLCEGSEFTIEELLELEHGDPMDTLLVTQFWGGSERGERVALGERVLLATIVFDPNEPANTTEAPSRDEFTSSPEPTGGASAGPEPTPGVVDSAELQAPEDDEYQAFVVERPQPGCSPLADLRAAGRPSASDPQYTVELPVVAEDLTGELWGAEPVLTKSTDVGTWYLSHGAWLVADEVSAGIQDPYLEWVGDYELRSGGTDPLRGDDCAYVEPIPEIGGAVFLVIDGVDTSAVSDLDNADAHQTWVYLGEAD